MEISFAKLEFKMFEALNLDIMTLSRLKSESKRDSLFSLAKV